MSVLVDIQFLHYFCLPFNVQYVVSVMRATCRVTGHAADPSARTAQSSAAVMISPIVRKTRVCHDAAGDLRKTGAAFIDLFSAVMC